MKRIKFQVGKNYKIKISNSIDALKVHIDGIIPNPAYSPQDDWLDNSEDLIVYRYWIKHKKRWDWQVKPYWEMCLMNDWSYMKVDEDDVADPLCDACSKPTSYRDGLCYDCNVDIFG